MNSTGPDTLTQVLAVVGAFSGVLALSLTIRRDWLDRPQLHVRLHAIHWPVFGDQNRDKGTEIVVTVINNGRQPTSVVDVSVAWDVDPPVMPGRNAGGWNVGDLVQVFRLEPGGFEQFKMPAPIRQTLHFDTPFRAIAEDAREHLTATYAKPIFRFLKAQGWEPPPGTPDELLQPLDPPPKPKRLAPWWQLWKDRKLRSRKVENPPKTRAELEAIMADLKREHGLEPTE